jgi:hypothetical protein
MESFQSTLSAYLQIASDYAHATVVWADRHPGLGGWAGAIGAILAIFVAWNLARREYLRTARQRAAFRREEIDLIEKIISDFERVLLQPYAEAVIAGRPEAYQFHGRHMYDAEYHGMIDLADLPVVNWPSLQAYANFKRYWSRSLRVLETSQSQPINREAFALRLKEHDEVFPHLIDSLDETTGRW